MKIEYKAFNLFYKWCEIKNKTKIIKYLNENRVEIFGDYEIISIHGVFGSVPNYVYNEFVKFENTDYITFISLLKTLEEL